MVLSVSESSEEAFEFGRLTVNEILLEPLSVERGGSGNLRRRDEWSFCLTAARMAAEQERR